MICTIKILSSRRASPNPSSPAPTIPFLSIPLCSEETFGSRYFFHKHTNGKQIILHTRFVSIAYFTMCCTSFAEVDYCFPNPCKNNGTCENLPDNYTCDCTGHFRGRNCQGWIFVLFYLLVGFKCYLKEIWILNVVTFSLVYVFTQSLTFW